MNPFSNKYLKILLIGLFIILIIFFSLMIYLLFQNKRLKNQTSQSISPTIQVSTPTPRKISSISITDDETAGWRTYINTTYKYSLSYPPTWQIRENVTDLFPNKPPSTYIYEKVVEFAPGIYIWVVPKVEPKQWITELLISPDYDQIKTEDITVTGIRGIKVSGIPGPLEQEWVFLNKNNKTIILYAGVQEEDMSVFDQILSTFRFIDQSNLPKLSEEILTKGWYWGSFSQKLAGTPDDWIYQEAGRSSCWHKLGINCAPIANSISSLCEAASGTWIADFKECESVTLSEDFCRENMGQFFGCLSPCRNEPEGTICNTVCMTVCKFN